MQVEIKWFYLTLILFYMMFLHFFKCFTLRHSRLAMLGWFQVGTEGLSRTYTRIHSLLNPLPPRLIYDLCLMTVTLLTLTCVWRVTPKTGTAVCGGIVLLFTSIASFNLKTTALLNRSQGDMGLQGPGGIPPDNGYVEKPTPLYELLPEQYKVKGPQQDCRVPLWTNRRRGERPSFLWSYSNSHIHGGDALPTELANYAFESTDQSQASLYIIVRSREEVEPTWGSI